MYYSVNTQSDNSVKSLIATIFFLSITSFGVFVTPKNKDFGSSRVCRASSPLFPHTRTRATRGSHRERDSSSHRDASFLVESRATRYRLRFVRCFSRRSSSVRPTSAERSTPRRSNGHAREHPPADRRRARRRGARAPPPRPRRARRVRHPRRRRVRRRRRASIRRGPRVARRRPRRCARATSGPRRARRRPGCRCHDDHHQRSLPVHRRRSVAGGRRDGERRGPRRREEVRRARD